MNADETGPKVVSKFKVHKIDKEKDPPEVVESVVVRQENGVTTHKKSFADPEEADNAYSNL